MDSVEKLYRDHKEASIAVAVLVFLLIVFVIYYIFFRKPSAVGQTLDLSKVTTLSTSFPDANGTNQNAQQQYKYTGNGVFTGVTSPTLFVYVFQYAGSSNWLGVVDNANSFAVKAPATAVPAGTWSGAGIVCLNSFVNTYSGVTALTLPSATVTALPQTQPSVCTSS